MHGFSCMEAYIRILYHLLSLVWSYNSQGPHSSGEGGGSLACQFVWVQPVHIGEIYSITICAATAVWTLHGICLLVVYNGDMLYEYIGGVTVEGTIKFNILQCSYYKEESTSME